jgi:hypothetical protein
MSNVGASSKTAVVFLQYIVSKDAKSLHLFRTYAMVVCAKPAVIGGQFLVLSPQICVPTLKAFEMHNTERVHTYSFEILSMCV